MFDFMYNYFTLINTYFLGVKKAYLHTYGDKKGDNGELQGYSKKMNDKGKDGYKHFDSYHKKDSDKYGYEIHSEFGKENKHKVDTGSKKQKHRGKNAVTNIFLYIKKILHHRATIVVFP